MIALVLTLTLLGPAFAQSCVYDEAKQQELMQLQSEADKCSSSLFVDQIDQTCAGECTDTFYNNLVSDYQCALYDMYQPPNPSFPAVNSQDFAGYADFQQELVRLSEACYFRNITLKGTQTLTEPPL
ncbi:uncharacterized protein LOC62_02G002638 [Vanrija pseudolonga]|uniref:Apple domain-containing protein n=1 Tax=Vanrija pseudolonga TaxID=143232 RepID=A0AAF0Y301_9TREE|nr:hypothetical protein LOC62_02G002638 [Vanrija pseudolonga]